MDLFRHICTEHGWSVRTKLLAVTVPLIVMVTGVAAWAVYQRNLANLSEKLTKRAEAIYTQTMADRQYYASVIVPRVAELGGTMGSNYREVHGQFPLPATFVREVSELTAAALNGYAANLISPWPINKEKGPKDQFQREGFAYLVAHPTGRFVRIDTLEGRTVMRVLMADLASAQSCVDCHNAHADSPKHDFKLNDLMGSLEVVIPADQYVQEARWDLLLTVAGGAGLCLLVVGIVAVGTKLTVTRPLSRLASRMRLFAGREEGLSTGGSAGPATGAGFSLRGDEVAQLEKTYEGMVEVIVHQENELRDFNAHLEQLVVERTRAVRLLERQDRLTMASLPVAVVRLRQDLTIRFVNRTFYDLLHQRPEETIGRPISAVLPVEGLEEHLHASRAGGGVVAEWEAECRMPTGERRVLRLCLSGIRRADDDDDDDDDVVLVIEDYTERNQAALALMESQTRLTLLNSIAVKVTSGSSIEQIIDRTLKQMSVHFKTLRATYATINEQGGLTVIQSVEPQGVAPLTGSVADLAAASEYLTALHSGKMVIVEDVTQDARVAPLASCLLAGGTRAVLDAPLYQSGQFIELVRFDSSEPRKWSEHEITTLSEVADYLGFAIQEARTEQKRRQAEEELRDTSEQLLAITEAMKAFLESGNWREASVQLLHSAVSQTNSEYGFVGVVVEGPVLRILAHEGIVWDLAENRDFYEKAMQTYHEVGYLEFTNFDNLFGKVITTGKVVIANDPGTDPRAGGRPEGHPVLRAFLGVPIVGGGEVVGMIGVANRPGGYTGAEEARITLLTEAAGVLYDSYRRQQHESALEEQLRQSQKMEAIGQLAGSVAHDFNNLLTVIRGSSEFLLRDLDPQQPLYEEVKEIRKAAERATSLTQQLLAFSRKQPRQPRLLDLNELLTDLAPMLQRLLSESIHLALALTPDPCPVKSDPTQLEQVILNLAINARDAMPQGGQFGIETANADFEQAFLRGSIALPPGAYVLLTVSDTGMGMDAETRAHCFEPFFTTKPKGQGTGLGLATVYGIVKQSDGVISVNSAPGQGTTFKIFLPRVDPSSNFTGPMNQ